MGAEAEVQRLRSTISSLHAKIADHSAKASKARTSASRSRERAAKASTTTSASSKLREAQRYERTAQDTEKRRADLERQLATRMKSLEKAEARLSRERSQQGQILSGLERTVEALEDQFRPEFPTTVRRPTTEPDGASFDVFISYASEDREEIARPLADRLRSHGLKVWFDKSELALGDSLRRKIDTGLRNSSFGVVILSPKFFERGWPQSELDALVARERANGHKVVLPIWHRLTRDDVLSASPSLADKVALNSSVMTLDQMASSIAGVVRPANASEPPGLTSRELQSLIDSQVEQIRETASRHGGTSVAVFGSVARGDAGSDSDIDFLVDFEAGRTLGDVVRLKAELEALLGHEVDVVSVGGLRGRDEEIPADAVWL